MSAAQILLLIAMQLPSHQCITDTECEAICTTDAECAQLNSDWINQQRGES